MNLPEPLLRDKDFMCLRDVALFGMTDGERKSQDTLIALAFLRGESSGMARALEYLQVSK